MVHAKGDNIVVEYVYAVINVYFIPGDIDVLIGVEIFVDWLRNEPCKLPCGYPN